MTDPNLLDAVGIETSPALMVALGAVGVLVALALLRLLRRIKRMIWAAVVVAAAGGAGTGGGWAFVDALTTLH